MLDTAPFPQNYFGGGGKHKEDETKTILAPLEVCPIRLPQETRSYPLSRPQGGNLDYQDCLRKATGVFCTTALTWRRRQRERASEKESARQREGRQPFLARAASRPRALPPLFQSGAAAGGGGGPRSAELCAVSRNRGGKGGSFQELPCSSFAPAAAAGRTVEGWASESRGGHEAKDTYPALPPAGPAAAASAVCSSLASRGSLGRRTTREAEPGAPSPARHVAPTRP